MAAFEHLFVQRSGRRVGCVGLGNIDYGDDGFGVRLAVRLFAAGIPDVLIGGATPENILGTIREKHFDDVVFFDAVDFGAAPGSMIFLGCDELKSRFPQISTHKMTLSTLAELLESDGKTRVWLLGVQPASLQSDRLSSPVEKTLTVLLDLMLRSSRQPAASAAEVERNQEVRAC